MATVTVADERFDWRSRSDGVVTLHWYEGDDAFADRALGIGSRAIEKAATLLGVTDMPEVDFFVYADQDAFYDALGPGTRENVGGQANADIRTMFGLITPVRGELRLGGHARLPRADAPGVRRGGRRTRTTSRRAGSTRASRSTCRRATTRATRRPCAAPWAQGRSSRSKASPGLFPTTRDRFSLAYAESASAVDFLVRTYGEEALVTLITSYADGVTDDEAFQAALGMRMAAFDDAWMSVGGGEPARRRTAPSRRRRARSRPPGRPRRRPDARAPAPPLGRRSVGRRGILRPDHARPRPPRP